MKIETLEQAKKIQSTIKEIDYELAVWERMSKGRLYHKGYDIHDESKRAFKSEFISEDIFNQFKSSTINSLKAQKLDLLQELENL